MVWSIRARTAETPKQPRLDLRLRAPYFYPDPAFASLTMAGSGGAALLVVVMAAVRAAPWVPIHGDVRVRNGMPICAMVLASGQYVFSRDGIGAYNLNVALDPNGEITLFAFADGFAPFSATLGPEGFPRTVEMLTAGRTSPLISMTRDLSMRRHTQRLPPDSLHTRPCRTARFRNHRLRC